MTYDRLCRAAKAKGLIVMGALDVAATGAKGLTGGSLILLGAGAGFWPAFTTSPEAQDGGRDLVDRWSARVIGGLAPDHDATAYFPFGGPPYAPFIDWALKSGRAFSSPTGMLVHDEVGLMISYRGALHIAAPLALPAAVAPSPCARCADRPCLTACPVGALKASAPYDVPRCHDFLDSPGGKSCMMQGCAVRRACPVSRGAGRQPAQSALHMRSFHP
ncbi:ferredoxin [Antarcticimicrobium sediminis]|uniref:Ferredoxin n=1 Tax=Antarcticimicrobium sediminis TaxID=2546227 RepID=A0A4R5EVL9_9RHOB|nr:ferredoxin [Antarcticimicrobium sediminis]TDE39028.1 ferredoxin [Antarcticimicrobium sediminis]